VIVLPGQFGKRLGDDAGQPDPGFIQRPFYFIEVLVGPAPEFDLRETRVAGQMNPPHKIIRLGGEQHFDTGGKPLHASRVPPSMSSRICRAAAAGSAASMIGRATTRWVAPAARAAAGLMTRFWSPAALPAGRMPGVTMAILGPTMVRT